MRHRPSGWADRGGSFDRDPLRHVIVDGDGVVAAGKHDRVAVGGRHRGERVVAGAGSSAASRSFRLRSAEAPRTRCWRPGPAQLRPSQRPDKPRELIAKRIIGATAQLDLPLCACDVAGGVLAGDLNLRGRRVAAVRHRAAGIALCSGHRLLGGGRGTDAADAADGAMGREAVESPRLSSFADFRPLNSTRNSARTISSTGSKSSIECRRSRPPHTTPVRAAPRPGARRRRSKAPSGSKRFPLTRPATT